MRRAAEMFGIKWRRTVAAAGPDGWKIRDGGSVVLRTVKCGGSNFTLQNSGENQKGKYKNTSKAATTSQEQNKNVIEILQTSANRSLHFAMWAPTPPKHTASFGPVFEYTRRWALLCTRVCVCVCVRAFVIVSFFALRVFHVSHNVSPTHPPTRSPFH